MRFRETPIDGVWVIDLPAVEDERGWFRRTFSTEEFEERGLDPVVAQCSVSRSLRAGTLRGMHLQSGAHAETKYIRCTRGAVFDVAVDTRPGPSRRGRWFGITLAGPGVAVVHPPGVAHGFITLEPDSELTYQMSVPHSPAASIGFRWDDPAVGVEWPLAPVVLSERDRSLPSLGQMIEREESNGAHTER
jgi:dTDP-4-dehydrorhamnose 3,5-epimerase